MTGCCVSGSRKPASSYSGKDMTLEYRTGECDRYSLMSTRCFLTHGQFYLIIYFACFITLLKMIFFVMDFELLLCFLSSGAATMYVRYKIVLEQNNRSAFLCRYFNSVSLAIGIIGCIGMGIVASFQVSFIEIRYRTTSFDYFRNI